MLHFTFSSILITVLASNLLIVFITLILRNKKLLAEIGYKILGIFLFFTVLRFLFPFELPVTTNIYFPKYTSALIAGLRNHRFHFAGIRLSVWNFMEVAWLLGILWNVRKYIQEYRAVSQIVSGGIDLTGQPPFQQLLEQICRDHGKANRFRIVALTGIQTPMVCRIKVPCILIPDGCGYTDRELYYILRHEAAHFFHHDLWVKAAIQMLCILYWWNPFIRLFRRQCDIVLEMRVDHTLTQNDKQTRADYLSCLIDLAKNTLENDSRCSTLFIPFCSHPRLSDRFVLLMSTPSRGHRRFFAVLPLALLMGGIYLGSIFYIFEASSVLPGFAEEYFIPNAENTYAVENGDGTYDIYFQNIYRETVDSLQYYPSDMKIYKKGTEP